MSESSPSGAKKVSSVLLFALIFPFITVLMSVHSSTEAGDRFLYDVLINRRVKQTALRLSPAVVPVDLDDLTELLLRERIDTREVFADLMTVLAGYNSLVVLDFLFRYPKFSEHDETLIAALQKVERPVVLAVYALEESSHFSFPGLSHEDKAVVREKLWHVKTRGRSSVPAAGNLLLPFPGLLRAGSVHLAHINIKPDSDGRYRRTPLLYAWEDGFIPSLSLAAAVLYLGIDPEEIVFIPGKELILPAGRTEGEYIRIPVDMEGNAFIPFFETWAGSTGRYPMHSLVEALTDEAAYEQYFQAIAGRIVVAAEITMLQKDFGPTSFEGIYPLSGIHTTVLSSVLSASSGFGPSFISYSSLSFKIVCIIILSLASLVLLALPADRTFNIFFLALFVLFTVFIYLCWHFFLAAPWYTAGACGLFFTWLAGFFLRFFGRYREQLLLHNALDRYFPHALAERIMTEGKTDLTPAYKELTILFSDICDFTKWSSDKRPEDVHAFLSDYLESMAEIVFAYGGSVDKFMGDGMLAFFGDPFVSADHVRQCISTAVAMQEKIRRLAEKWKPLIDIDLMVRMGINTGTVVVGNLGTKKRIEYTVIGAAANLAQRMEGSAPPGGILVTANTWEQAREYFIFSEKKLVTVKGYAEPVEAYEVLLPFDAGIVLQY
ncbi:MAG: adenylate/guanylate cyclase domain-containing protein [Treponema sp.]|jgi:adenylate cyclase|nr:adenylate/guanylate cyclase domain-containing protein [Treponema sp.]